MVWTLIRLLLSLIWVHTVCKNDFYNQKQMTKQTTTVVTGALRVKKQLHKKPNLGQTSLKIVF